MTLENTISFKITRCVSVQLDNPFSWSYIIDECRVLICSLFLAGMQQFLREISFHGIGLDVIFSDREATIELMTQVKMYIDKKIAKPLPATVFNADQVEDAYRYEYEEYLRDLAVS